MYLASYFLAHANICSPNTLLQVIKAITFEKMFLSLFLRIYIHIPVFSTAYFMKIRNKYTDPFCAAEKCNYHQDLIALLLFLSVIQNASMLT